MDLRKELARVCEAFEKKDVRYIVVGGMAVALHGIPRYTEDIDFVFFASKDELEKIKRALFEIYKDESIFDLTEKDLDYSVIRYGTPGGYVIDLIFKAGEIADYVKLSEYVEEKEIEGLKIKILSKKGLVFLKGESLRQQDRQDTYFLKKLLEQENAIGKT